MRRVQPLVFMVASLFLLAQPLAGQRFPAFGGGEVRAGIVLPDDAERAVGIGLEVDLGRFLPLTRVFVGGLGFDADVDRLIGERQVTGDIAVRGGRAGIRLEPLGTRAFTPYFAGALNVFSVSADADQPGDQDDIEAVYEGTYLGLSVAAGGVYPLDATRQVLGFVELRRAFVSTVGHWALDAGLRLRLRSP